MAEVNPRYQDDWLVLIGGPQLCKTSFGVNCQLLWIWENKSRFSERELRKVLGPYNIWTHKHSTYHWPLKFPFYNKAFNYVIQNTLSYSLQSGIIKYIRDVYSGLTA